MGKFIISIFIFISTLFSYQTIKICDDINEWPPYIFFERKNGHTSNHVIGIVPELLKQIFTKLDINYSINMIPWKRCTFLVAHYNKSKKYAMFLDGSYSKKRDKLYYHTLPIYSTKQAVFYSSKKYTKKEILNKIKNDINSLRICDVNGYQVEHYKNVLGYTKQIDLNADNEYQVFEKISRNRCDITIAAKDPIYGQTLIGKYTLPKDIKSAILPQYKPIKFYMWISKQYPQAKILKNNINQTFLELKQNGTYNKILNKYIKKNSND